MQRLARRQHSFGAANDSAIFDGLKMVAKSNHLITAADLLEAERQHLVAIVADNARGNVVGASGERLVARVESKRAASDGRLEQNFEIDFVIRHIDAGGVVDRVGVDASAGERVLDARFLREAEIAALDHDLRAQFGRRNPARVIGVIADVGVALDACAHVSADAAVVEQIDRRAQDRLHQRFAIERVEVASERHPRLRAQLDSLLSARKHAAAGRDQARVVIRPLRARQFVQPFAFVETRCWIRLGIDKDVAMIERGDQFHVARAQKSVAEHVARHVADADDRDRLAVLDIAAHLAQVAPPDAKASPSQKPRASAMPFATSEKLAVPLSAATTRYGPSASSTLTCGGCTMPASVRLSVRSRIALISVLYASTPSFGSAA